MYKPTFVVALGVLLAVGGSSWAILPAPMLEWSESRVVGFADWTSFGTVFDDSDTVLVGAAGTGGGIYELGTTWNVGTAVIKAGIAGGDALAPTVIGNHVYYAGTGATTYIRRVDLADFGNPSASVNPLDYGIDSASGYLASDGTYLFMGHDPLGAASYNSTKKLDVGGILLGEDPFSLSNLWDPYVAAGIERGEARISYYDDGGNGQIWKTLPLVGQEYEPCIVKVPGWHDADDPSNVPVSSPQLRPWYEKTIGGSWYYPGYTKAVRYGDVVFVAGLKHQKKGHVLAYPVLGEGDYGLEDAGVWPGSAGIYDRDDWNLSEDFPNGISDIAVIGDGAGNAEGLWAIGVPVDEEGVDTVYLRYYSMSGRLWPRNRADATEDDFVGADDLVRILSNWGQSGVSWTDGDVSPYRDGIHSGNDFVGADDYVEVLSNWGADYIAAEPTPEPSVLALLAIGGLAAGLRGFAKS